FTEDLAERAVCIRFDDLPEDVVELARQCLLDWIGVALAGSVEPAATLLADELLEHRSADGGVTLVGRGERLPVLDAALVNATATALGIAATQAAGLKSMFGTMCKPLHAGKAASNGLLAARLAARGYTTAPGAVETVQGFAETHSDGLDPERGLRRPRAQWHL